jgi:hypothetical protein
MKRLLVLFIFLSFGLVYGQFAETPQYEFNSTSSHQYIQPYTQHTNQYTIPVAEIQEPFYNPNAQHAPIRRAPVNPPADPGWEDVPVGDPDIFIILILLFSYFYVKKRRQQFLLYTGIKR